MNVINVLWIQIIIFKKYGIIWQNTSKCKLINGYINLKYKFNENNKIIINNFVGLLELLKIIIQGLYYKNENEYWFNKLQYIINLINNFNELDKMDYDAERLEKTYNLINQNIKFFDENEDLPEYSITIWAFL